MAEVSYNLFDIDTKESRIVAEAVLIGENLDRAIKCLAICACRYPDDASMGSEPDAHLIQGALVSNAVLLIIACFDGKNKAFALDKNIVFKERDSSTSAYYHYLKDLRDTYVAHTFGPMRQAYHGVILNDDIEMIGQSTVSMTHIAFSWEMYNNTAQFATMAKEWLEAKMPELISRSIDSAKRYTKAELLKLKVVRPRVPGPSDLRLGRNSYKTKTN